MSGRAIYQPKGKAGEYSEFATNFYTGCSNNCSYCYLKHGALSSLWSTTPRLKKCFKSEEHAVDVFEKELKANLAELRRSGLLLSFTTDPMLPETFELTRSAISECVKVNAPITVLTKRTWWVQEVVAMAKVTPSITRNLSVGVTLTGRDELEPGAESNFERIAALHALKKTGFRTWASIEPIIDFESSFNMMLHSSSCCDGYKIGLESGKKYDAMELKSFFDKVNALFGRERIYWKNSVISALGGNRELLVNNSLLR